MQVKRKTTIPVTTEWLVPQGKTLDPFGTSKEQSGNIVFTSVGKLKISLARPRLECLKAYVWVCVHECVCVCVFMYVGVYERVRGKSMCEYVPVTY